MAVSFHRSLSLWMSALVFVLACVVGISRSSAAEEGKSASAADVVAERLRLFGHRNWIVIADSAYPAQTSPGVETIHVGGDQLQVVKQVLAALEKCSHVKPICHTDAELKHLDDSLVPGVEAFRKELTGTLQQRQAVTLPHEQLIAKLDEAGKAFRVLILKTDATIPYSSVFLQLDCGYWSAEKEAALRARMR